MKIRPPSSSEYGSGGTDRRILGIGALLIAVFCGWQLIGLPGAMIRKYVPPFDMPWYGFGVKQVAVDSKGTWHIARDGYADRATYYTIAPGAQPEKSTTVPTQLYKLDTSGNLSQQSVDFADGELAVKASRQYWVWRWRLKNMVHNKNERDTAYAADGSEDLVGPFEPMEPNVALILSDPGQRTYRVLAGYQHYRVFDGAAAKTPNVWLTTERGRNIHRLVYREFDDRSRFDEVVSKPTKLEAPLEHSTSLGVLEEQGLVFMLLPSGRVDFYDAMSLDFVRSEKLAGDWRREYGELWHSSGDYSFYQGLPLAQQGYDRIMRSLMLLFLLSLITLALTWSTACTSISDQTTGDTTPNSN
jgi:hypothetical protein